MDTSAILPTPRPEYFAANAETVQHWGAFAETIVDDGRGARETVCHSGTVTDLMARACTAKIAGKHTVTDNRVSWAGCDFATAVHLAITGWHEGAALMDGLFARITATKTDSILPHLCHTDEPDGEIDVAMAIDGEDECWIAPTQGRQRLPAQGRFVNLILDPFASSSVDADVILKRGTYFVALATMLERGGYRTRIGLRMPNEGSGKTWLLDISIKGYAEDLDLPRVFFWLAHPGALRHLIIGAYCNYRTDGVGPRQNGTIPEDAIVAPGITSNSDLDGWLEKTLADNGLTVEG